MFPVALVVMLMAAAPALAQTAGGTGTAGSPTYALEGDHLVVGGDQAVDCASFTRAVEQYEAAPPSGASDSFPQFEKVSRYAQLCYQYGLSPSADETPSATARPQAAPAAELEATQGPAQQALPATGGATLLPFVAGLLIVGVTLSAALRGGR